MHAKTNRLRKKSEDVEKREDEEKEMR